MNTLNEVSMLKLINIIKKVNNKKKFFVYHNPENSNVLNNLNLIYSKKKWLAQIVGCKYL